MEEAPVVNATQKTIDQLYHLQYGELQLQTAIDQLLRNGITHRELNCRKKNAIGLCDCNSPICTLSQNGYGANLTLTLGKPRLFWDHLQWHAAYFLDQSMPLLTSHAPAEGIGRE